MAAIPLSGGDYELRVQEFPQPVGTPQQSEPPTEVTAWINSNQPGTPVPGGGIDRIFIPYWLGSLGTGNPVWCAAYVVLMYGPHH